MRLTPKGVGARRYAVEVSIFSKRQREQAEAEARARGESTDDYFVEKAPQEFRQQLWYAIDTATTWPGVHRVHQMRDYLLQSIRRYLCEEYGWPSLAGNPEADHQTDVGLFVTRQAASTAQLMDVVDAVITVLIREATDSASGHTLHAFNALKSFNETVVRRLREHRLAYDIVDFKVVAKSSEELHQQVVVPALTLLRGQPQYAGAEKQYRDALDELAAGNWADAVTDANAAVENLLRTIVGFQQGQLPDLLAEARRLGLFGDNQTNRIKKVVSGLTALSDVRNTDSDAHGNETDSATAWLAVHWAGALLVYLVQRAGSQGAP